MGSAVWAMLGLAQKRAQMTAPFLNELKIMILALVVLCLLDGFQQQGAVGFGFAGAWVGFEQFLNA